MQYPQIQFYRGSLVRLASGKLKQVEDLSSDDFLESARLFETTNSLKNAVPISSSPTLNYGNINQQHDGTNLPRNLSKRAMQCNGRSLLANHQPVDENNNHNTASSVFNSPELTPSFDSPSMELMDTDYDMVSSNNFSNSRCGLSNNSNGPEEDDDDNDDDDNHDDDDDDEELDVVTSNDQDLAAQLNSLHQNNNPFNNRLSSQSQTLIANAPFQQFTHTRSANIAQSRLADEDLCIDSSVVRDFLEVGPPSSASPKSPNPMSIQQHHSAPSSSSSSSSSASCSPGCQSPAATNLTVLIKFFLESSRTIVFIEVPIEHPFFVFHRGWSSWNPQRTYDKFGLKCRKLKIGDTCISLIRRQHQTKPQQLQTKQQESDQCNILFSSIKINE